MDENIFKCDVRRPVFDRAPDGKDRGSSPLPVEFGEFAGTKRLSKCRESLEEIAQLPFHGEAIRDLVMGCKMVLRFVF